MHEMHWKGDFKTSFNDLEKVRLEKVRTYAWNLYVTQSHNKTGHDNHRIARDRGINIRTIGMAKPKIIFTFYKN